MNLVVEGLEETLILLDKGWTQKAAARASDGRVVNQHSEEACEWCLLGAMTVATTNVGGLFNGVYHQMIMTVREELADGKSPRTVQPLVDFNDNAKDVEEVKAVVRRAIKKMKNDS